jgi:hypothetical protein
VPIEFAAAVDAALELHESELAGFTLTFGDFAQWRVEVFKSYLRARRVAENEYDAEPDGQQPPGDSDAFKFELLGDQKGEGA